MDSGTMTHYQQQPAPPQSRPPSSSVSSAASSPSTNLRFNLNHLDLGSLGQPRLAPPSSFRSRKDSNGTSPVDHVDQVSVHDEERARPVTSSRLGQDFAREDQADAERDGANDSDEDGGAGDSIEDDEDDDKYDERRRMEAAAAINGTMPLQSVMNRSRPPKAERRSSFYRAPELLDPTALEARPSQQDLTLSQQPQQDFRRGESSYLYDVGNGNSTIPASGVYNGVGTGDGYDERVASVDQPSINYPINTHVDPQAQMMYAANSRDRSSFYRLDSSQLPPPVASDSHSSLDRTYQQQHTQQQPTRYQSSLQPAFAYSNDQSQPRASYQQQQQSVNDLSSPTRASLDQPAQVPLLDQSHLRPGNLASLLSHEKTLDLYRANAKKTGDAEVQFEFCTFVMDIVAELEAVERAEAAASAFGGSDGEKLPTRTIGLGEKTQALVAESVALLSKLANRGHVKSQYFLADCYTQGVGTPKNKRDFDKAYPLFVLAGKHGHADACFRAAQCCENGWGCRKDSAKAVTFLRKSAMLGHPPAMHRLGLAEMNGELSLTRRPKEGLKWIKRAAELADQVDPPQPQSLHELAMLNEKGIENVIFVDHEYAAELYARAAELGYSPSAYKLGECYEYGKMGCPQDSALSIHYYNIAAQQNHREACFALTAWYLVGSPGILPQSDTEAYLWARKAAEMGLAKAEYAVGYFTEVGIGTHKHARDALEWFRKAAEHGDKRAKERLRMAALPPPTAYQQQQQHSQQQRHPQQQGMREDHRYQSQPADSSRLQHHNRDGSAQPSPALYGPSSPSRSFQPPVTSDYSRVRLESTPTPPSQTMHSDPYSRFYEPQLDTYGRPAPIEGRSNYQSGHLSGGNGGREKVVLSKEGKSRKSPKKGEKGEDCLIC